MATQQKNPEAANPKHHFIRTTLAVLFGVLALWLVLFGIVTVWLNRTVTDTTTYVDTVAPLATRPEVKDFIIDKVDTQISQSASGSDLADLSLTATERTGKTDEQLKAAALIVINDAVAKTFDSAAFQKLWVASNRTAHKQLITQLSSNSDTAEFDMSATATGVLALLKQTRFAPLIDKANIPTDQFKVKLQSSSLASVRNASSLFKRGTIVLVLVAFICLTLSVVFSVHHIKTLRRILIGCGIGLLLIWVALTVAPARIAATSDPVSEALIKAVATVVLRDLRLTTLIAGVVCMTIGLASEIFDIVKARKTKKAQ